MSVQSDCEMMSVDIMEIYAEKHHLTGDEAIKLFHKYQVYEKINDTARVSLSSQHRGSFGIR